jgi:hypothetical protein
MKFVVMPSLVLLMGCSTTASFKLPPNTDLMIKGERITFKEKDDDGLPLFKTRPFFWGDISYSLVQGEKVIKEGQLPSKFRIVSIFWPPYGFIYWPIAFRFDCYDLSRELVEKCLPSETSEKGNVQPVTNSNKQDAMQKGPTQ